MKQYNIMENFIIKIKLYVIFISLSNVNFYYGLAENIDFFIVSVIIVTFLSFPAGNIEKELMIRINYNVRL